MANRMFEMYVIRHIITQMRLGVYDSVKCFIRRNKKVAPATVFLDHPPAETAQIDFGAGPVITDVHTGKVMKTWFFVMTLPCSKYATNCPLLKPVRNTLASSERHPPRILPRWHSLHTNARLEGFTGLFQAARVRARGYLNVENFIVMFT